MKNEIQYRARIIKIMQDEATKYTDCPSKIDNIYDDNKEVASIFIDDKGELIKYSSLIFTHKTGENKNKYIIPEFIKLNFLNEDLALCLMKSFNIENRSDKYRELQRILKVLIQIEAYEPQALIKRLASQTNKKIEENPQLAEEYLTEMLKSIFFIREEKTIRPENSLIQVLDENNNLVDSKKVYFNKTYPNGEITELIFRKYIDNSKEEQFILDFEQWNFCDDKIEILDFFKWLGVKEFPTIQNVIKDFSYLIKNVTSSLSN